MALKQPQEPPGSASGSDVSPWQAASDVVRLGSASGNPSGAAGEVSTAAPPAKSDPPGSASGSAFGAITLPLA